MLSGLFTPKLGLGLIKHEIEKQTNLDVKNFSIYYVKRYSNLKFKITDEKNKVHEFQFLDTKDRLTNLIKLQLKAVIKKDIEIDAFILSYINKEISTEIYYKNEHGKKEILKETI